MLKLGEHHCSMVGDGAEGDASTRCAPSDGALTNSWHRSTTVASISRGHPFLQHYITN